DAPYLFLAYLSGASGMGWLALSQPRHWRAVMPGPAPDKPKRVLRIAGWVSLFASLIFCILRDGGSFAAILWPLILGAAALAVAMALTYRPSVLKPLGMITNLLIWRRNVS
ncbi:MAG: DUF3325 domain-containing protein, partial [Pseudomonadota bacterium]